jgi:hypothetical protein
MGTDSEEQAPTKSTAIAVNLGNLRITARTYPSTA